MSSSLRKVAMGGLPGSSESLLLHSALAEENVEVEEVEEFFLRKMPLMDTFLGAGSLASLSLIHI